MKKICKSTLSFMICLMIILSLLSGCGYEKKAEEPVPSGDFMWSDPEPYEWEGEVVTIDGKAMEFCYLLDPETGKPAVFTEDFFTGERLATEDGTLYGYLYTRNRIPGLEDEWSHEFRITANVEKGTSIIPAVRGQSYKYDESESELMHPKTGNPFLTSNENGEQTAVVGRWLRDKDGNVAEFKTGIVTGEPEPDMENRSIYYHRNKCRVVLDDGKEYEIDYIYTLTLADEDLPVNDDDETVLYTGEKIVPKEGYRAIAYVTVPASENWRWIGKDTSTEVVSNLDTRYVTHINFAFGMIKPYQFDPENPGRPLMDGKIASPEAYKDPADGKYHYRVTLDGWIEEMMSSVSGGRYLNALVDLKRQKPDLKVLLTVGGWNSDGFCYMTRTAETRAEFIQSLIDLIREYNIDGFDLNWETPNNGGWGEIASCDHCIEDGRNLLKECRAAFDEAFPDEHKLICTK